MSQLTRKIWYGTFHHRDDIHCSSFLPFTLWSFFLAAVFIVRLQLPVIETGEAQIHQAIIDSLLSGQHWGRQGLVGSLEFPPLPTIALFFFRGLGKILFLPPLEILVAAAQVWALFYFLRTPLAWRDRIITGAVIIFVLIFSPEIRQELFRLDPNWFAAIPLSAGIYHFVLWSRNGYLRDIVLLGVNCALLVCAGPAGLLVSLIFLSGAILGAFLTKQKNHLPNSAWGEKGIIFLAWTPLLYSLFLIFLGNWLILENPFFFLERLVANFSFIQEVDYSLLLLLPLKHSLWLVIGGIVIALLMIICSGNGRPWAVAVLTAITGLFLLQLVFNEINLYLPAAANILLYLSLIGILLPFFNLGSGNQEGEYKKEDRWVEKIRLPAVVFILLSVFLPRSEVDNNKLVNPAPPSEREVINTIDQYTPDTRIIVHGMWAPRYYFDLKEQRFISRLDFDFETILNYARQEDYFYLLLPPDNGRYYHFNHPLAEIHKRGHSQMVLIKSWPGNWQLWRILHAASD